MRGETKISGIIISLLLFSGVALGLSAFFGGTASSYLSDSDSIQEFSEYFDSMTYIDTQMKAMQQALNSFDPLNPLSWGNFVSSMINLFNILFSLPGLFHDMLVYLTEQVFFIPGWTAVLVEVLILTVIVFAMISAVNKYGA